MPRLSNAEYGGLLRPQKRISRMTEELIQGTYAWRLARCGSLGASQVNKVMARTKSGGIAAGRANVMADMIVERLTGIPTEVFITDAMRWGIEHEPYARDDYRLKHRCSVEQVGIVRHPSIPGTHASPDGIVGADGLLEIKCPQGAAHLATLRSRSVPSEYITQIQWQMACTGRAWCDFASFHPKMPESMMLFVIRVERDNARIAVLEKEVRTFLAELDKEVAELRARFADRRAAA